MDDVPVLFIEQVSALLSRPSLDELCDVRDSLWEPSAKAFSTSITFFSLSIHLGADDSFTIYPSLPVERLSTAKEPRCEQRTLSFTEIDFGEIPQSKKVALAKFFSVRHVTRMNMFQVPFADTKFENFWPRYVSHLTIHTCTFGADSTLCAWLKSILKLNCIKELNITEIEIEGTYEDLEDDVLNAILHGPTLETVTLNANTNFMNVTISFWRKAIAAWMNSAQGFPGGNRVVSLYLRYDEGDDVNDLRRDVFHRTDSVAHPSGSARAVWRRRCNWLTFYPWP
ncbi:hypothetical protein QR680_005871 [Steinernema hermaphroditum]|uniref:Uncharacterized protein n=1 Tax=Steinernema hermaphroditum TaxID=289476 RepID=A0AA39HVS4_9BILA|nr:hypothetical protein QR680_005871 [Steinernema hermaphroditum]